MSCNPLPTQTLFRTDLLTTQTVGTSTIQSLTTLPASSTTSTQSSCILSATNGTCQTYATTEIVVAIPGAIQTVEQYVPYTSVVVATNTIPTTTLFGTCSEPSSSSDSTTTSDTPITTTTPPTPNRTTTKTITSSRTVVDPTSSRGSISYGSPSIFTLSVTVTLPDGQVSTELSTGTSTPTLWVPAPQQTTSGSNVGLVVGSVVGGFAALSILAGVIWLLWRKRRVHWDDIFDEDNELEHSTRRRMELIDAEPKPYEYGIVGAQSPPGSPHFGAVDRRASSAPLLAGSFTSHSTSPSMDFASHTSHVQYGSLSIPRQPTGGSSVHSRDASYQSGHSPSMSARDRMPYADDHGVLQPFLPPGASPPVNYMQTADRKVRPQSTQNAPPSSAPQFGMATSSNVSTSSNAGRASPPSAHSSRPLPMQPPRAGEGAQEGLPPPYSQSANSPSTTSSPSTLASTTNTGQRFGVANPDNGVGKTFSPYR